MAARQGLRRGTQICLHGYPIELCDECGGGAHRVGAWGEEKRAHHRPQVVDSRRESEDGGGKGEGDEPPARGATGGCATEEDLA